jgi:hypothetical protein
MAMLMRKRQLAAKIESIEGTAETLAAVDAKLLAYDPKVSFSPGAFDRNPVRSSLSRVGKVFGKFAAGLNFKMELRGSGIATTEPEWGRVLRACGFGVSDLRSITIGAVTSGPFQHGEIITGGTSLATGRVIIDTVTGTTTLYYVAITGTFQNSEVLTGGTSGATATTGSTSSAVGKVWEPVSFYVDNIPSLTMATYEGGLVSKKIKGARGNVKFTLRTGEPVMMDFSFQGVRSSVADVASLSGIAHETTVPPVFQDAAFLMGAYGAKVSEIDIDIGNSLAARDDVNDSMGLLSFLIADRMPVGSVDPEMVTIATYDFYAKWFAGTMVALDFTVGSTTGNKFRFFAPKVQYTGAEDVDRNGIQVVRCPFDLNANVLLGNTELAILAL